MLMFCKAMVDIVFVRVAGIDRILLYEDVALTKELDL